MNRTTVPAFTLSEIDYDHVEATAFNMLYMVWMHRTTAGAFERGVTHARQLGRREKTKIGSCQVIDVDAEPPDADARNAFVAFLQNESIAHSSVIYDGTGFKAASVRAIINLQLLASKPRFPHNLFSSVKQAARWHAMEQAALGRSETASTIEALITHLRALHRERFPQAPS